MSDSEPTRREFLAGRRRETSPSDEDDAHADQAHAAGPVREASYVEHVARKAMACQFEFVFNAQQYTHAIDTAMQALDLIERLEAQLTVYRDTSEVSRLNRSASTGPVRVETGLFRLLALSRGIFEQTGGAFDITAAPLSKIWGFSRGQGEVPTDEQIAAMLRQVGSDGLQLNEAEQSVAYLRPGLEINLGGIGKGWAVDRCVESMVAAGVGDFLLHAGQSSIVARGSRTGIERFGRCGWTVGLTHPVWPERRLAEIQLVDQALGTSGTSRQAFYHRGRRLGHILDPRTGWPAEGVLQATVLAPQAAEADALATACYVMGRVEALEFVRQRGELAAVLVTPGARRGEIVVDHVGLAEDRIRWVDPNCDPPDGVESSSIPNPRA